MTILQTLGEHPHQINMSQAPYDIGHFHRGGDTYGWHDKDEANTYTARIRIMQLSGLLMWPPPAQIERSGRKDPDVALLDVIANEFHTLRPTTTTINLQGVVNDDMIALETVLKRSNSDCGQHVILPEARRNRKVDHLRTLSLYGEQWLMQEYVTTLHTVGEWRTFIVNGSVIHTVHTYRHPDTGAWVAKQASSFWSLKQLRYVFVRSTPPSRHAQPKVIDNA